MNAAPAFIMHKMDIFIRKINYILDVKKISKTIEI